jgi:hypothetical protein
MSLGEEEETNHRRHKHLGLLYKLSKLKISVSLSKLIGSFLSQRKFRVWFEGEMSTPKDMQAVMPQGSNPD